MNRTVLLIGILLLAVAAVIGVVGLAGRDDDAKNTTSRETANRPSSRSERSSRGGATPRKPLTPAEAALRLRNLLDGPSDEPPTFRELEALAGKLSGNDLEELLGRLSFEDSSTVQGWIRFALFAEWGRRDPMAAMESMTSHVPPEGGDLTIDQAWSALFSGWAEKDPLKAYEVLQSMGGTVERPGPIVFRNATTAIFRELARQDPILAWKMVQESEGGLANEETVAGFFAGLRDSEELQRFLADWNKSQWDTDEAREAYAKYDRERSFSNNPNLAPPLEEAQITNIARAWAQHDLDAALAWLKDNGPGSQPHRNWRASQAAREWARTDPAAALEKLADERFADQRIFLGQGAIMANPSLAPEVMERLVDANARFTVMTLAVTDSSVFGPDRNFPSPGTGSTPLDPVARYDALAEAITTAGFPAHRQQELLRQLNVQNREFVPAAREALEAPDRQ